MGRQGNSNDPLAELRGAKAREQAEREERERIAQAVGLLRNCADYATSGMAIHVYPGESWALEEERAGVAHDLRANQEFCEAWVRARWIPSIEAVLRVVDAKVIEQWEPVVQDGPGAQVTRAALRTVHRLYCSLVMDRDAVSRAIIDLVSLRRELGSTRYVIQQVFTQLAGHIERAARGGGGKDDTAATPPAQAPSKTSPLVTTPVVGNEPVRLSASELAQKFGVPNEALRKALDRYRMTNPDKGFIEVSDRSRKEPQYLYNLAAVQDVIDALKRRQGRRLSGPT